MSGVPVLDPPVERHLGFNDALHPDRSWIRMLRFAVGAFVLVALAQKTYDATLPGSDVDLFQLYSEFTVQSNLVLGIVLIASAARPLVWLGYPVAFLIFSWVRGAIDGWYVYDFLDPTLDGGWPAALATTAQVLVAFLVIAFVVHAAGNGRAALAAGHGRR